jgi:hypothetical protein
MTTTETHDYLSTACLHAQRTPDNEQALELHSYCKSTIGSHGPKTPAVCKFCGTKCRCECHWGQSSV